MLHAPGLPAGKSAPAWAETGLTAMRARTIALVDNVALSRECTAKALEASLPEVQILTFPSLRQFAEGAGVSSPIDLLLFNVYGLPSSSPEVELAVAGLRQNWNPAVILICDRVGEDDPFPQPADCVRGVVPRYASLAELIDGIRVVEGGGSFVPSRHRGRHSQTPVAAHAGAEILWQTSSPHPARLTAAQLRVLRGISEGKPNKVIARELAITESTVKVHLRHIMAKLEVRNRTQVALVGRGIALEPK